ncbi:exopolysaccharide biosynthesis protein [Gordoniibacillus kamchatkensis]|uniref:Exopolysaccharide biosynthesis protein n=1 Tax=Gordoniibacillus kamchatkensis TaxID=1590651 RepID=A0ABR5A6Y3_9BACL|nr:phosphodiester glycosidase family protein [Paenibacillus sp. VKM B-2647]KIL36804.1 exopolysaccharide biosynthesis protein [Paenibacillus sp. VKM B-2647]
MTVKPASSAIAPGMPPRRPGARKKRRSFWGFLLLYAVSFCMFFAILFSIWFYLTPWGADLRYMMADTLITTQHRDWAKYLIGSSALEERVAAYMKQFNDMGDKPDERVSEPAVAVTSPQKPKEPYEIEPVEGKGFKGYIVYINDPTKLRVIVPNRVGKGEKVTSMVQRTGALLGINGGGFIDPNWEGNGFQPEGTVMSGGQIYYNDSDKKTKQHMIGIDKTGRLIAGNYSANELLQMGVQEAVSFSPRFIVNGEGQIKNQADGWGIAPRTCIGQTRDGRIVFAVIDGRQPGHSIGATLYDVQKLFLERDVVIAANLDGGSSTVLVKGTAGAKPEIVNKPSSEYGERYLPTAWLLYDNPQTVLNKNIWEGLDIRKIDPSKW